jgi:glycosyltransferase involved in cell wall biosynthesis
MARKSIYVLGLEGFSSTGGAQEYTRAVTEALPEALYRAPHDKRIHLEKAGLGERACVQGDLPRALRAPAFAASLLAECLAGRVGALWAAHLNLVPVCYLAHRMTGVPYAVTLHGIEVWERRPKFERALRSACLLLPVSEFTKDTVIRNWGLPENNFRVLYDTFDPERFAPGPRPDSLMTRYGIRSGDRVVLTLARMNSRERYKGHDQLLEAIAPLARDDRTIKYLIAGTGDDAPRLAAKARDLGIEKSVVMAGFVPEEDLPDLYRLCDVFAMPSRGEGFGIVYLEALASGKQVIAGNKDAGRDALAGGRLGRLVDPDNIEELREALSSALADRHAVSRREQTISLFGPELFRNRVRTIADLMMENPKTLCAE